MKADVSVILNLAADLLESSSRRQFTREEIVEYLRVLPDEIEYQAALHAATKIPGRERMS